MSGVFLKTGALWYPFQGKTVISCFPEQDREDFLNRPGNEHGKSNNAKPDMDSDNILVLITSDRLGQGDEVLGKGLMKNFILTLKEMGSSLWRIIFLNAGVRLVVEGSRVP